MLDYWQDQKKPLFPDLIFSKPETKAQAGHLGLIGGNKLGFLAVAKAHQTASAAGIGQISLVLPVDLKNSLKQIPQTVFAAANPSGGLAKEALADLQTLYQQTGAILMIGDAGKNTETQVLYEEFVTTNTDKPIIIARDAVDLSLNSAHKIIDQDNIVLVMSFSQLQKLFQTVHYPIVITHSMTNLRIVEAIHKFSLTYPITLVVFHNQKLFSARNGRVVSTDFTNPTEIWQGITPAKIATWCTFFPNKKIEAIITSIIA